MTNKKLVVEFTNNERINLDYIRLDRLSIEKVILYNSMYLINDNNNVFNYNSTTYNIKNGNFTGAQLATELSNITNMTVTYDSINYKFTFTFNSSIDWQLASNNQALNHVLGFNNANKTGTATITSDNCANLSLSPYYLLYIKGLQSNDVQNIGDCYEVIYNDQAAGSMLYYKKDIDSDRFEKINYNKIIDHLLITIKDQFDNIIDFNGQKVVIEFNVIENL